MLLNIVELKTYIHTRKGLLKAVDGVTYDIAAGEVVALVGESGCGKTMSALSLLRLIPQPAGEIVSGEAWFNGEDLLQMNREQIRHIRGAKIGTVFQEPMTSLNPVLTIGRQIQESAKVHLGMDKARAKQLSVSLLERVGIPDGERRLGQYPHQFSGGMRQRVMLAIALACSPRLIIADEPTTALDVTIQAQILDLIHSLAQEQNLSVLLITHNLGIVARYASRINVMYAGKIVERGSAESVFAQPRHPYTKALLRAVPRLDHKSRSRLMAIEGQPPDMLNLPPGCAFRPRCPHTAAACSREWPPLVETGPAHLSRCPWATSEGGRAS